jgi:ribosomal protein S1
MSEESMEATADAPMTPAPTIESLDKLKPKMRVSGKVERLELYGAFIDIGVGVNALIHISKLGAEQVNRVSDVLNVGDEVTVWVERVDRQRNQIMVSMVEPLAVDWNDLKNGQVYTGKVSRLEDFGAFVDIGAEREGLVHISELSHEFVKHPSEMLKVGGEIEVQVLGFSKRKRRIDLSIKALQDKPEIETRAPAGPAEAQNRPSRRRSEREEHSVSFELDELEAEEMPTAMEIAMRRAMGDDLPERGKGSGRKRRRQEKQRSQQEDILSRTLQLQQEN